MAVTFCISINNILEFLLSHIFASTCYCIFYLSLSNRRVPGEGNGTLLQYSCLENPMDRGTCQATVHRVTQSWTWLKWLSTHACRENTMAYAIWEAYWIWVYVLVFRSYMMCLGVKCHTICNLLSNCPAKNNVYAHIYITVCIHIY